MEGLMFRLSWAIFTCLAVCSITAAAECLTTHPAAEAYEGWQLAVQPCTPNEITLFEAIENTRSLGLGTIHTHPGQKISAEIAAGFGPDLPAEHRKAIQAELSRNNVALVSFALTDIPSDEMKLRKLFAFAAEMKIQSLIAEPKPHQLSLLDELCCEYKIRLAIHNRPKPAIYWHVDSILKACQGRSRWIGAFADTDNWVRSGLDPVQCLKHLQGRILDAQLITEHSDAATEAAPQHIRRVLEELHRQNYRGTVTIKQRSEDNKNTLTDIRQSIAHYDRIANALKPDGWKPLFHGDFSNASVTPGTWLFENGVVICKGLGSSSDLWTTRTFSNYMLDFEFKLGKDSNSGIFLRAAEKTWLPWVEVQIADSFGIPVGKNICGSLFDVKEPTVNAVRPIGEWNRMTISADGPKICVILNGLVVVNVNLNDWTEAGRNPDGTSNKFTDIAYRDLPRDGWIGFQDHGFPIQFRNIRIKELQ